MNSPKISVIIPCYNQGIFLEETIDSVLNQTVKDVEIIVVNDGSTDASTNKIIASLKKPKTRIITTANGGSAAARNSGFKEAKGEFIQFLDGDDLLLPDKFEKQINFLDKNPDYDFCYGNFSYCNEKKEILPPGFEYTSELKENALEDILFKYERGLIIKFDTALYRKNIWKNELPFDEQLRSKEDWIFWVDIFLKTPKFKFFNEDFLLFRRHQNNKTRNKDLVAFNFYKATTIIKEKLSEEIQERFLLASFKHINNYAYGATPYKELYNNIINSTTYKFSQLIMKPFRFLYKLK